MKVIKVDHIHFNTSSCKKTTALMEALIGTKMAMEMDFTDYHGLRVAFNPFPLGVEIIEASDKSKEMGKLYAVAPKGVYAISLNVPDIDEATAEMESMGYKMLMRYDFGPLKEALFDTKKAFGVFFELIEYPADNIMEAIGIEEATVAAVGEDKLKFK